MTNDLVRFDLGEGHGFTYVSSGSGHTSWNTQWPDGQQHDDLVGIIEWHAKPDGSECGGFVGFQGLAEPNRAEWRVLSLNPLHLEPSILCSPLKGGCGSHGWIRGGRWENG